MCLYYIVHERDISKIVIGGTKNPCNTRYRLWHFYTKVKFRPSTHRYRWFFSEEFLKYRTQTSVLSFSVTSRKVQIRLRCSRFHTHLFSLTVHHQRKNAKRSEDSKGFWQQQFTFLFWKCTGKPSFRFTVANRTGSHWLLSCKNVYFSNPTWCKYWTVGITEWKNNVKHESPFKYLNAPPRQ